MRALDFFSETGDPPPTRESFQADLDDLPDGYSRADEVIYKAHALDRLAGYAEVLRGYAHERQWIVGILLVDEAMRGRGVGHAVAEAIVDDATNAGMDSVAVGVIRNRERSMAFWFREGFTEEVSRRPIVAGDVETEVVRLERRLRSQVEPAD